MTLGASSSKICLTEPALVECCGGHTVLLLTLMTELFSTLVLWAVLETKLVTYSFQLSIMLSFSCVFSTSTPRTVRRRCCSLDSCLDTRSLFRVLSSPLSSPEQNPFTLLPAQKEKTERDRHLRLYRNVISGQMLPQELRALLAKLIKLSCFCQVSSFPHLASGAIRTKKKLGQLVLPSSPSLQLQR